MLRTLFVCAGLFVVGILLFVLPPPIGGAGPDPVCAEPGAVSSGFADEDSGCPLTIESAEEILDYESNGLLANHPVRAVGLLGAIAMVLVTTIALLVTFLIGRSRASKSQPQQPPVAPSGY